MDKRQLRTRNAIFTAFARLLADVPYENITIQQILDEAQIGRSTFYAHFETKEQLLKAVCEQLFEHVVQKAETIEQGGGLYPKSKEEGNLFCHILYHLVSSDHQLVALLSGENNQVFLQYFRLQMCRVVDSRLGQTGGDVPREFLVNHIAGSFVEMVQWWIQNGMKQTPKELDIWFRKLIEPNLPNVQ